MSKKCKKNIVIFLSLILLVINSTLNFSAVVSDNDGTAFITKAEFEALKKDFNNQIDKYNISIDGKIDGAIASYLAGVNMSKKKTRKKLIKSATSWLMYNTNDYPKYVDGKPYVTGYSFSGNLNDSSRGFAYGNTISGVNYNGNSSYLTNGGFKKHIVGKPSKNEPKNGNANYVSEWQGYYKDEGEFLTMARFYTTLNGSWAAKDEDDIQFRGVKSFSNSTCPVYVQEYWVCNPSHGTSTVMQMYCASAQRIKGELVGDTNVSIFKNINDNRFWDSTVSNRVGITDTTPAITYRLSGANFRDWIADVIPSSDVSLACAANNYNSTEKTFTMYWNSGWPDGAPYDYENFARVYTITSYKTQSDSNQYYLLKMANDPNNLQFVRLWSAVTDTVTLNLNETYESTKTSADYKSRIRPALLWDGDNIPHLSMGAGYPFLEVKYGEKVDFDFKINGTGSYRVYGKYGPFNPASDPASEADVLFEIGSTSTTSNVLSVTGGVNAKMKFDVTYDGTSYVFLKWSDATGNNGGTMDLSSDPVVTPSVE